MAIGGGGCEMRDTGYGVRGAGCGMRDARYKIRDADILHPLSRIHWTGVDATNLCYMQNRYECA